MHANGWRQAASRRVRGISRLRLGIVMGAFIALSGLIATALWMLKHEHHKDVQRVSVTGDQSAQELAKRTMQVLDQVSQTGRLVKTLHAAHNPLDLHGLQAAGLVAHDFTRTVFVTDARGFVIASTHDDVPANIADEADFKFHRVQPGSALTVGLPTVNPLNGGLVIPVMQRITGRDQQFHGVVVALVDPSVFTHEIALGDAPSTVLCIVGQDDIVRARMLDGALTAGATLSHSLLIERAAEMRRTFQPAISPIDQQARFVSVAPVEGYPLLAVVAVSADVIFERQAERLAWTVGAGLLLGFLVAAGSLVLWVQATRLETSRAEAREAHALYEGAMDGSIDAVFMLRPVMAPDGRLADCTVIDANRLTCQMLQVERAALIGKNLCELFPSMRARLGSFWRAAVKGETTVVEAVAIDPRLAGRWFQHQIVPIKGGAIGFLSRDITDRVIAQKHLAELARVDSLTGLANRRHFQERLDEGLRRAQRQRTTLAILFLDLDGFKTVNDRFGHEAGDHLLVEVARRLQTTVRDCDVVARLGGDEFAVLCECALPGTDLEGLCERLMQALCQPHALCGQSVWATPSIGVACWDGQEPGGLLVQRADKLMYEAKQAGKACYRLDSRDRLDRPVALAAASARLGHKQPSWSLPVLTPGGDGAQPYAALTPIPDDA